MTIGKILAKGLQTATQKNGLPKYLYHLTPEASWSSKAIFQS